MFCLCNSWMMRSWLSEGCEIACAVACVYASTHLVGVQPIPCCVNWNLVLAREPA